MMLLSNPNAHQTWTFGWSALTFAAIEKSSRSRAAVSRRPKGILEAQDPKNGCEPIWVSCEGATINRKQ